MTTERKTRLSRRISKPIKRWLVALAVTIVPRIYMAYMWLVWKTSKVEWIGRDLDETRKHYGRAIAVLWHEEVFFVAYAFRKFRGHTLASHGDFGEVITRMLELCDFVVFRGGSSSGKTRRSPDVLPDMIEHMNSHEGVIYGITVDGSNGPAYVLKKGALRISVACRAPIIVERTWCRRYIRARTWDRTLIPLPFNHIVHVFGGPYLPPRNAHEPRAFERFWAEIQNALLEIGHYGRRLIEDPKNPDFLTNCPTGWKPADGDPPLVLPMDPIVIDSPKPGDALWTEPSGGV